MKECAPTLNAAAGMSGNNKPFAIVGFFDMMGGKPGGKFYEGCPGACPTLTCGRGAVSDIHTLAYRREGTATRKEVNECHA